MAGSTDCSGGLVRSASGRLEEFFLVYFPLSLLAAVGRRRPDAALAAQGGQIGANGGHQRLQRVQISLEPVCWALFVPNRLTAAETRKRF